jgi:hypothetical protein
MNLDLLKINFAKWRKGRTGREAIPDSLWKQVYQLGNKYSISQICKSLRISHAQYKSNLHRKELAPKFLEIKTPEIVTEPQNQFLITLESADKTLTMTVSNDQIPIVFAALKGLM